MSNFLYIVESQGYHKIGVAESFTNRLSGLQTGNPFKIEVYKVYRFNYPSAVETVLHDRFESKRGLGEWFTLSNDDLTTIDTICTMLGGRQVSEDEWDVEEAQPVNDPVNYDLHYDLILNMTRINPRVGRPSIIKAIRDANLHISTERAIEFQKRARAQIEMETKIK